jgi:hypothetical protein
VQTAEESLPFRWDLVTPDQLGSLLEGTTVPDLWFLNDLVACTGKVLARSADGDLVFVGRSLDSMFDLLGGALGDRTDATQLRRLPLSFQRTGVGSWRQWRRRPLTAAEQIQARRVFAAAGVTPHGLARRQRPVTFVDVVYRGSTFHRAVRSAAGLDRRGMRAVASCSAQDTLRRGDQPDEH